MAAGPLVRYDPPGMASLRATYVVPEPGRVLEDAVVEWRAGRIVYVGRRRGRTRYRAPGCVATLGLVNAHAHLELSALRGVVPRGTPFPEWVLRFRDACRGWELVRWRASAALGRRRLVQTGTTSVGDVVSRWSLLGWIRRRALRVRVYAELLEPREGADRRRWEDLRPVLEYFQDAGVAPHAPYSVTPWLYRTACMWAREKGRPIMTHAAETHQELRILADGRGELARMLRALGAPLPFPRPPALRPIEYLGRLGVLGPTTNVVHANHLEDREIELLRAGRCTVTFCPGSHAWFGHRPHPLRRLLRAGVSVALGTDSWASNDDLDMRREMKLVREEYGVDPWDVLAMATVHGAQALFPGQAVGRLREGWAADLTVFDARGVKPEGIAEWLVGFRPPVRAVIVGGRFVLRDRRQILG